VTRDSLLHRDRNAQPQARAAQVARQRARKAIVKGRGTLSKVVTQAHEQVPKEFAHLPVDVSDLDYGHMDT
jgi:hypothetical protein